MKWYRKVLRGGVIILFASLFLLHIARGPPKSLNKLSGKNTFLTLGNSRVSEPESPRSASLDAAPRSKPYRRRVRPLVYPSTCYAEWSDGGYQTYLWTDAFLKNDAITIISQCYVGIPRAYENIKLKSPLLPGGEARFDTIHVRDSYESVIVSHYTNPVLARLDRLEVEVQYESIRENVTILRAPGGWESSFAMCALFLQDRHLLRMWAHYWYLLGVDTFYLYWNGESSEIPYLRDFLEDVPAHIVFIHWPYDYWVPNKERPHHGQPQAWNSCYQRNKDKHDFLVFYDLVSAKKKFCFPSVACVSFKCKRERSRLNIY